VFVARRSTKGKWFNYPSEVEKPVYALDKITENDKEVYVVESFFNCLTLWKWGKKAVALMGTGSENQYEILKRNKTIQRYILAFDGDNAGKNGAIKFHKNMKDYALISYIDVPLGKDINDLSFEEFSALKAHI
jgi:DNA primase